MKRKITTTLLLLCTVFVCFAAIAELSGKWKGTIKMSDGSNVPLTYVLKVDGEKLTGSIITPQEELEIYDGKVKGADFTFKVDVNGSAVPSVGKFYADGDSVTMIADLAGQRLKSTLKRVADKK
ncbi:MAG: glycoside hydrolase [Mucilaginibacter sp.]|nr:glycoside hydrolase [Mucilaginibacter sp.]